MGVRQPGIDPQGGLVLFDGFCNVSLVGEDVAEKVVSHRLGGIQGDGLLQVTGRLVEPALKEQEITEVEMGLGMVGA